MKTVSKNTVIIVLCLSLVLIMSCGCTPSEGYTFPNKGEPIESIELLYYPWFIDESKGKFGELEMIRRLESNEMESFIKALYALPTAKAGYEPPSNYGTYIARVNYANGDAEYFGSSHIEFVECGEKSYAVGEYYFTDGEFEALFFEYAGDIRNLRKSQ